MDNSHQAILHLNPSRVLNVQNPGISTCFSAFVLMKLYEVKNRKTITVSMVVRHRIFLFFLFFFGGGGVITVRFKSKFISERRNVAPQLSKCCYMITRLYFLFHSRPLPSLTFLLLCFCLRLWFDFISFSFFSIIIICSFLRFLY